jgi:transposase InsO family protein
MRYNKSYPGELVHFDTKRLPLLKGQSPTQPREYLLVAIDDFSRELYADILPDKTQGSAAQFLVGKAERAIRTLMEMWHHQHIFKDSQDRQLQLGRFINFYNTVKPHKGLNNSTPYEMLYQYFKQPICKQP